MEFYTRHLHVDVDAVHQRTQDALLVARYRGRRTGARPGRNSHTGRRVVQYKGELCIDNLLEFRMMVMS